MLQYHLPTHVSHLVSPCLPGAAVAAVLGFCVPGALQANVLSAQVRPRPSGVPRALLEGVPGVASIGRLRKRKQRKVEIETGAIILPTQTMHYYKGNPSKFHKIPISLSLFDPPKIGNWMTPLKLLAPVLMHVHVFPLSHFKNMPATWPTKPVFGSSNAKDRAKKGFENHIHPWKLT